MDTAEFSRDQAHHRVGRHIGLGRPRSPGRGGVDHAEALSIWGGCRPHQGASCRHAFTGFGPDNLTIFNYTEMGNDLLEDGLYVMEDTLADPAKVDAYTRFVRASMKGLTIETTWEKEL